MKACFSNINWDSDLVQNKWFNKQSDFIFKWMAKFHVRNYTSYFAKKGIRYTGKKNLETSTWLFEYGLGHLMQIDLFVNVK